MKTISYLSKMFLAIILIGFSQWTYAQEEIFKETFDKVSGDMTNANHSVNFETDADHVGWTGEKYYGAGGCIKLGASSSLGSLTSPAIDLSDPNATYTLTFNTCAWKNDKTSIKIILDNQEPISVDGLTNSGDYINELYAKTFSVELKNGTAVSKITFEGEQKSKARFFIDNIVITKTENSGVELKDPECAFSTETATYILGEAFTAPVFTTVSDGKVSYKSSNTNVATVDNNGNITAIAAGKTIISASINATDTYKAGTASYMLTVTDPNIPFSESFAESLGDFTVTQTDEIWSHNSQYKCAYANGFEKGAQNLKLISPVINLTNVTEANLSFEHAAGYINNNDLTKDFTLWIKEKDGNEWTQLIIPTYPDSWTFVNSGEISLNSYCGKEVQIAFNYMCSEQSAAAWEIKNVIIKKAEPATLTISISEAGYATYFTNKAWVVADNMKAGIVTGVANKNLAIDWIYGTGNIVPANTAVLIQADAKEYVCEISDSEETTPAENLLKGSVAEATTEGENCLFYKLSYENNGENLGFYWAAENGAAFTNGAHKAYLALPTEIAKNTRGFGLEGDGTTGIDQIVNGQALVNVYTIDGILVRKQVLENQALNGLKKGIYIVNGKKVIK
jgi:hypothetical protein